MIQLNKCDVLEAINGLFPENEVKAVRPVLLPSNGVKNDKNVCYFGNINGKTDLVLLYGGVVVEPVGSVLFNQFTGGFVMFSGYEITLKFSIPEIDVINNMPEIPTFDKVCCTSEKQPEEEAQEVSNYEFTLFASNGMGGYYEMGTSATLYFGTGGTTQYTEGTSYGTWIINDLIVGQTYDFIVDDSDNGKTFVGSFVPQSGEGLQFADVYLEEDL